MGGRLSGIERTPTERAAFLEALAEGLTVGGAADKAKISRKRVYAWREEDPDFAAAWNEAIEHGTDKLEDEAKRRGFQGSEKPVYQGGRHVGNVTEYSDNLAMFLLKGRRPEKFKERIHAEHTGKDGGPIQHENVSARDQLISRIAGIAERVGEEEAPRVTH